MHALIEVAVPVNYELDRKCIVFGVSEKDYMDYVEDGHVKQIAKKPYSKGAKLLKAWTKEKVELTTHNLVWFMFGNEKFVEKNIWIQRKMMWLLGYDPVLIEYDVILNPEQYDKMISRVKGKYKLIQDYKLHLSRMLTAAKLIDYSDEYKERCTPKDLEILAENVSMARDMWTNYYTSMIEAQGTIEEYEMSLASVIEILERIDREEDNVSADEV